MSSYLFFYLRQGDEFIPLDSYSRNTLLYQLMEHEAPYETIAPLSVSTLEKHIDIAVSNLESLKNKYETQINYYEKALCASGLGVGEREELINLLIEIKQEYADSYDENLAIKNFFQFLLNMTDIIYSNPNKNWYIYAGIEADGSIDNIDGEVDEWI